MKIIGMIIAVICIAFVITDASDTSFGGTDVKGDDAGYTVTFVFGEFETTYTAHYGDPVEIPTMVPVKDPSEGLVYTFVGWEGYNTGMTVTSDLEFRALFASEPMYSVKIVYNDGTDVTVYVPHGGIIAEPRDVFKYYLDEGMSEPWSATTRIYSDITVFADVARSGTAGDDVYWELDRSTGTLTLYGEGATYDWEPKTTPWYSLKNYISSLVIGEGVTYLGEYACYKYSNLTEIVFPDSLVGTGKYAVVTYAAEHIKIGSGLKDLGMRGLFGMTFYEGDAEIAAKDFNLVSKEFYGNNGTLYLEKINGSADHVKWTIDYATKTLVISGNGSAGNWAATTAPWYQFRGYFENVVVEEGVTEIGDFSFYSYSGIRSIVLADSVARIGTNSLRGCSALETVVFGSGLTAIGSNALTGYTFYTSDGKTLKANVANMAGHMFVGTGDKTFVDQGIVPKETNEGSSDSSTGTTYKVTFAYGKFTATYHAAEGSIILAPPMVPFMEPVKGTVFTFIGWDGFIAGVKVNSDLTFTAIFESDPSCFVSIIYDDGTEETVEVARGGLLDSPRPVFGYYLDEGMTDKWYDGSKIFHDMTLYAHVAESGAAGDNSYWTFDRSTGTLTIYGEGATYDWAAKTSPWYSIRSSITSLIVDEGITYLGEYAFYKFPYLNDIVLADSLIGTGKYCIVSYVANHIYIGTGLKELGMRGLFGMTFYEGDTEIAAKDFNLVAKEFYGYNGTLFLDNIHGTASDVSWKIDYITKTLVISGNGSAGNWAATTAPWYQFRGYFENVVVEEGVTEIGDFSFYSYSGIRSIVLADSVARIGTNSLRGCSALETVVFGSGLTAIGSNALTGYTFYTSDGKTLKANVANMAGYTFTGNGDKTFVREQVEPTGCTLTVNVTVDGKANDVSGLVAKIGTKTVNFTVGVTGTYTLGPSDIATGDVVKVMVGSKTVMTVTIVDGANTARIEYFTATFASAGGSPVSEQKVLKGDAVTEPSVPTRTGYDFVSWNKTDGTAYDFSTKVTGPITLSASWSPKTVNVVYNLNYDGAGIYQTVPSTYGQKYVLPSSEPVRAGYAFLGWFTAPLGGTQITSGSVVDALEPVLYAHWNDSRITVIFYAQNYDMDVFTTVCTTGEKYVLPATPVYEGHTFSGWYTAATGGTKVTNKTVVTATADHILYAHWKAVQYPVTIDLAGGSVDSTPAGWTYADGVYTKMFDYGTMYTSVTKDFGKTPVLPYNDFFMWIADELTVETEGLAIEAVFLPHAYKLTFDMNGGTGTSKTVNVHIGDTVDFVKFDGMSKEGMVFDSWNLRADGNGTSYYGNVEIDETFLSNVDASGTVTVYAKWTSGYYTATVGDYFYGKAYTKVNASSAPIAMNAKMVVVKSDASSYTVNLIQEMPGSSTYYLADIMEFEQGKWPVLIEKDLLDDLPGTTGTATTLTFTRNGTTATVAATSYHIDLVNRTTMDVTLDHQGFNYVFETESNYIGYSYAKIVLEGYAIGSHSGYNDDKHNVTYAYNIYSGADTVVKNQSKYYSDLSGTGFVAPEGKEFFGWYYFDYDELSALRLMFDENDLPDIADIYGHRMDGSFITSVDLTVYAIWKDNTVVEDPNIELTVTNLPAGMTLTVNGQDAMNAHAEVGDTVLINGGTDWTYDSNDEVYSFTYRGTTWFVKLESNYTNTGISDDGHLKIRLVEASRYTGWFSVTLRFYQELPQIMGYYATVGDTFEYSSPSGNMKYTVTDGYEEYGYYTYSANNVTDRSGYLHSYPFTDIPEYSVVSEGVWKFNGRDVPCYIFSETVTMKTYGITNSHTTAAYVGKADGLTYGTTSNGAVDVSLVSKSVHETPMAPIEVSIHVGNQYLRHHVYNDTMYYESVTWSLYSLLSLEVIGSNVVGLALTDGGAVRYTVGSDYMVSPVLFYPEDIVDGAMDLYVVTYVPGATLSVNGNGGTDMHGNGSVNVQITNTDAKIYYPDMFGFNKNGQAGECFVLPGMENTFESFYISFVENATLLDMYVNYGYAQKLSDGVYFVNLTKSLNIVKGYVAEIGIGYGPGTTVTYKANGAAGADVSRLVPSSNGTYAVLDQCMFSRTGYTFLGWGYEAGSKTPMASGTVITDIASKATGGKVTLYAIWGLTFTAVFDTSGHTLLVPLDNREFMCGDLGSNTFPQPQFDDYVSYCFGWTATINGSTVFFGAGSGATYSFPANLAGQTVTFTICVEDSYEEREDLSTVEFKVNKPSGYSTGGYMPTLTVLSGTTVKLPNNVYTMTGGTFDGWNTKADGTGIAYTDGDMVSAPAAGSTLTLYAKWKIDYTLYLFSDEDHYAIIPGDFSEGVILPACSDAGERIQIGWTDINTEERYAIGDRYVFTSGYNAYLLAEWERTVTLYFHMDDDTDTIVARPGSTVTIPEPSSTGGRLFYAWTDWDNQYMAGDEYTVDDCDKDFYAIWGVNLKFAKNYTKATGTMSSMVVPANSEFILPEVGFTDPNHSKVVYGWSTDKSASIWDASRPGETMYSEESDITVYAIWDSALKVVFNAGSGSGSMDTVYLPRNGDNMSPDCKFTAPSSKAFLKWTYVYDGDTYEILPGDTFNCSDVSTITLTAQWSKKVTFTFVPG
ncbi:MAG: InlB B-repeat-containing protein, partial [archaeon]|nr:InlB B-repeat-containing protein [archaeon]